MKKVRLYAYLNKNLGDDIMVDILLCRYPKIRFYCLEQYEPYQPLRSRKNLICSSDILNKYRLINNIINILTLNKKKDWLYYRIKHRVSRHCSASVLIGGSMFQEGKNHGAYFFECERKKLDSGPLYVIGSNFGPYFTKSYYDFYKYFFSECKSVTFRDKKSYNQFSFLPNIRYASDIVFAYNNRNLSPKDNSVVISVIDFSKRDSLRQYCEVYENLIRNVSRYIVDTDRTPVLFSFCSAEGDSDAVERIWNGLEEQYQNRVRKEFYSDDVNEAVSVFCKADRIIATRFHSVILALKNRIPFFCIAYNEKIVNVMTDLNMNNYCMPNELPSMNISEMMKFAGDFSLIATYESNAENQFSSFDDFSMM